MPVAVGTYTVTCQNQIAPNAVFIRVHVNNLAITLAEIIRSVSEMCWISRIDPLLRSSFLAKAQPTADYLATLMDPQVQTQLGSDTGQYFVSEMARSVMVNDMHYLDIPLGELLKQKVSGNPGFDLFSVNLPDTVLFGESKYVAGENAYGRALSQINDLVARGEDIADLSDIRDFCPPQAMNNANQGIKGYIAAFSSLSTPDGVLIQGIQRNQNYQTLLVYSEVVCIAIDV